MIYFFHALPLPSLWQRAKEMFASLVAHYSGRCNPSEATFENWLFIA